MILGKYLTSRDDISDVLSVRRAVFETIMPDWAGRDALDDMSVYALVFANDAPAGSGRLSIQNDKFFISRVGVLDGHRRQGLGDMLIRMLLLRALDLGAIEILVSPLPGAREFYRRYGFIEASDGFMRATPESISRAGSCGGCCGEG